MRKKSKSHFQISTSSNESRPGTLFKMCSRSRQYQRCEYHQKLLSQTKSYGISKSDFWFWAKSGWGQILNRFAIRWPLTNLRIFWKFSNWYHPNQNQPMFWGSGCMLLGSRVVPNWEFSENFQSGKPPGEVVPIWKLSEIFRIGFQKRIQILQL